MASPRTSSRSENGHSNHRKIVIYYFKGTASRFGIGHVSAWDGEYYYEDGFIRASNDSNEVTRFIESAEFTYGACEAIEISCEESDLFLARSLLIEAQKKLEYHPLSNNCADYIKNFLILLKLIDEKTIDNSALPTLPSDIADIARTLKEQSSLLAGGMDIPEEKPKLSGWRASSGFRKIIAGGLGMVAFLPAFIGLPLINLDENNNKKKSFWSSLSRRQKNLIYAVGILALIAIAATGVGLIAEGIVAGGFGIVAGFTAIGAATSAGVGGSALGWGIGLTVLSLWSLRFLYQVKNLVKPNLKTVDPKGGTQKDLLKKLSQGGEYTPSPAVKRSSSESRTPTLVQTGTDVLPITPLSTKSQDSFAEPMSPSLSLKL